VRRIRAILDKCEFAKQAVSMIELVDEDLVDLCDSSVLQLDEIAHNKDILAFGHTSKNETFLHYLIVRGTKLHDIRHIVVSGVHVPKHGGEP